MSAADEWYLIRGEKAVGPFTLASLQAEARAGTLKPTDQVWREGMAAWVNAGGIMEIFSPGEPARATPRSSSPPPLPPPVVGYAMPQPQYAPAAPDAMTRMLIPVGRSGWAIAAGYLGLLSPLAIFAPFAVIISFIALSHLKRNPALHGKGRAIFGLVMGILCTIGFAVGLAGVLSDL